MVKRLLVAVLASCFLAGIVPAGENPAVKDWQGFLSKFPLGVMTTVEGNQPRTRIFQFLWTEGERTYFSTGNYKDVYTQMQANNRVSFCTWDPKGNVVLSVDGPVTFVPDLAAKEKAMTVHPDLKEMYKSPDNPKFAIFYIQPEAIYTFSFAAGKEWIKH
ncbi:MAG: pyridoxamine 5'-phosphate oxidase family protein [Planctomycetota bacterium]|jgi:uncharacterized pyridoxamine 5'-phosphate oxidase family protein|nr:pyridoxamine 5'-phosphate oxidase family protein [Planctomycetota bacterium]